MKIFRMILILVFTFILTTSSYSQYKMTILNASKTALNTFEFDIDIVSTSGNFNLTSYQVCLNYNAAMVNGGTLSFSYVNGSGISNLPTTFIQTDPGDGESNLIVASNFGLDVITTTPVRIGHFKITNTVNYSDVVPFLINWDFDGLFFTVVNNLGILPVNHINALSPYTMSLVNDLQTSDRTYEFDINIVRTAADFNLTSYQIALTYNPVVINGGTLSFTYLAGSSTLTTCLPASATVVNDGGVSNFVVGTLPGLQVVSTTPLKIGRFRVTNTVPFPIAPMNLAWDFAGNLLTILKISTANMTVTANHVNLLSNSPLPVELVSFTGKSLDDKILLHWETKTEVKNNGFDIEKAVMKNGKPEVYKKIAFVKGHGNSNSPKEYSFFDNNVINGDYAYRLKQIDNDGNHIYSDNIIVTVNIPVVYNIEQNYPNPFNPSTSIKYQLPFDSRVNVRIYNSLGELVDNIVNEIQTVGYYTYKWNASNFVSGVYFVNIEAKSTQNDSRFTKTLKMLLLK